MTIRAKQNPAHKPTTAVRLPATFKSFITRYPGLGRAHEDIAKIAESAGPLDAKALVLIKIGICIGAGLESALRSHVPRPAAWGQARGG